MAFKIVVSEPKSKKAWQVEKDAPGLFGKKIGEQVDGSLIGLNGFTLEITGGSDKQGFPMRYDLVGNARKKVLLSKGPGFKSKRKGMRKRKYVRGNAISEEIAQVNLKIVEGEGDIATILGVKPKKKEGEAEEAKPEEKKEEPKQEPKPEEKKEEPKPEQKEEAKPEEKPEETSEQEPKPEENQG
jgi:small subunit ribosomal protein S6e